ncbi:MULTISPECIES: LEVG family PEP-CTERM protein [unclassified Coleofasciculus]|uniref:LEVG family PEP-CTERM protein n=1 Tax=unclassified Coleofasciculus TaxID=2692782 RepID=UPI00187EC401|nr:MULTISPECIES: LEVG family PEP-CTERM protein [unclassified Coleofasciculus]MBE9126536.1 LEVG family PEP-CTERM protein [Coleofasciculus sp. LEGE 07081]MBE9149970.1 LEVG family PEP-CTERM protein [Coleofasciculus sp. LEGE 07092]
MNFQHITNFLRNTGAVASLVAASTVATGFLAPSASAISFVPTQEGEVNVGFDNPLAGSYLQLNPLIQSIESLVDPSTNTLSRLFVDLAGTPNTYGQVDFLPNDVGTPAGQYFFRPVALQADGETPLVEQGQLEVGRFKFNFAQVIDSLSVTFFDTEFFDANGVGGLGGVGAGTTYEGIETDGTITDYVSAGGNKNFQTVTFENVSMLTLDLGERGAFFTSTGDGVLFQVDGEVSVPEPGTVLGLGALALTGAFGLRKRNKKA